DFVGHGYLRRAVGDGFLDMDYVGDDTAGGHHTIAALQVPEGLLMRLPLFLLRANDEEIEDQKDQAELEQQRRPIGRATAGRGLKERGNRCCEKSECHSRVSVRE